MKYVTQAVVPAVKQTVLYTVALTQEDLQFIRDVTNNFSSLHGKKYVREQAGIHAHEILETAERLYKDLVHELPSQATTSGRL